MGKLFITNLFKAPVTQLTIWGGYPSPHYDPDELGALFSGVITLGRQKNATPALFPFLSTLPIRISNFRHCQAIIN